MFKNEFNISNPENDKLILSCNLGMTACVVELALASLGNENAQVYVGSY